MSFMLLGILNSQAAGGGGNPFYQTSIGNGTTGLGVQYSIGTDVDSNIHLWAVNGAMLLDSSGAVQWSKKYGQGQISSVAGDATHGTVYSGTTYNPTWTMPVHKRSISGAIQWAKDLSISGDNVYGGNTIHMDSSGNSYLSVAAGNRMGFAKFDTNGNFQFAKGLQQIGGSVGPGGITTDSSGNIYTTGATNGTAGSYRMMVQKWNSAGALQWEQRFGNGYGGQLFGNDIAVDSNGNVFVVGNTYYSTFGSQDAFIIKYNSSGSYLWAKHYGTGNNEEFHTVGIDENDYVYAFGSNSGSLNGKSYYIGFMFKMDNNGTTQYQRYLDAGTGQNRPPGVVTPDGAMVMSGEIDSNLGSASNAFVAKQRQDGTSQPNYITLYGQQTKYAASNLSEAYHSPPYGNTGLSVVTMGFTVTNQSFADTNITSFTQDTAVLP
tara:strand:- start:578 stop:1879 length:1302 start_codon:yes stop_codon:yes gene_type:complete